jgi:hypothetical protein
MTWFARPRRPRPSARVCPVSLLAALALGPAACEEEDPGACGEGGPRNGQPWFQFGHLGREHFPSGIAVDPLPFEPLEDGDAIDMIAGGQGLEMFALPVRAGNFDIDIANEQWPILDMHLDVEDHNDGIGGHFARLANYPVWFDEGENGDYEFFFVTIILPADDPLADLVGLPGSIEAVLEPEGKSPLCVNLDFVVGDAP